jgi:hypothetical protein
MNYKKVFLILILLTCTTLGFAQQYGQFPPTGMSTRLSPFRMFLNKFSLGISTGYGQTFYSHALDAQEMGAFYLQKRGDKLSLTFDDEGLLYNNWYHKVSTDTATLNGLPDDRVLFTDSSRVAFQSASHNIPVMAVLYFDWRKFRIGGGAAIEFQRFTPYTPDNWKEFIGEVEPETYNNIAWRYFFSAGYNFYTFQSTVFDYHFIADIQTGMYNYGKLFDLPEGNNRFYFNLGVTMEKQFSEYFRAFVRPSYEFKEYTVELEAAQTPIKHMAPSAYVQAGVFLKFPETPRCPIKSCKTQVKHVHQGREFRGQPIYKKQNRKYGENNRTLLKYKRKYRGK